MFDWKVTSTLVQVQIKIADNVKLEVVKYKINSEFG